MCLDGSTKIKTSEGNKKIKDIKIGDYVYALNGLKKVLNTFGPQDLNPDGKEFLELKFDDGSTVKCTHDHKFLTKNGEWKEANELKIGSEMY